MTRPWTFAFIAILATLAAGYTALGLGSLAFDIGSSYPIDLRLRWTEERLVLEHIDPQVAGHPDPGLPASHQGARNIGGGYPPWAYTAGLILAPPISWTLARLYSALLNACALGILCWWAYNKTRRSGPMWTVTAIASTLAVFPVAICLSYGQYAVIITACLAGVDLLLDRRTVGSDAVAGVLLAMAVVKPQLGGLFALAVLIERRWLTVATCVASVAAASGVTWLLTGVDPITMLSKSAREASAFTFQSVNPLVHVAESWLGFSMATAVLGIGGLIIAIVLLITSSSRVVHWSVCATIAMFWGYRKNYDVPLLVFLLIGLLVAALEQRRTLWWVAYGVLGVTLWAPLRDAQWSWPAVQWIDVVVWSFAAGLLWNAHSGTVRRAQNVTEAVTS